MATKKAPAKRAPRGGYCRKNMNTPANKQKFLDELGERCHVGLAARAVGVSRQRIYEWARKDPVFLAEWEEVTRTLVAQNFEDEAIRRGVHGIDEPVIYQGTPTGMWVDKHGNPVSRTDGGYVNHSGKAIPADQVSWRPHTIRRYSDTMLAMLLNGARPEKYQRHRHEHTGKDGGPIQTEDKTDPTESAKRIAFVLASALAQQKEAPHGQP